MVSLRFLRRGCHPVNLRLILKLNAVLKSHFPSADIDRLKSDLKQAKELATKFSGFAKELVLIGRYERRALSRRKFAVRDLDAVWCQGDKQGGHRRDQSSDQTCLI